MFCIHQTRAIKSRNIDGCDLTVKRTTPSCGITQPWYIMIIAFVWWPWTLHSLTWWRHQMETFSALLALCVREFTGRRHRPMTRNFDAFFNLRLKKRLSKQSRRQWLETPLRSLWRHCDDPSNYNCLEEHSNFRWWSALRKWSGSI